MCDEHRNDPAERFRVLPPVFRDFGGRIRFHGNVVTLQCFEDNTSVREAVQSPGHGRVLVVDGGGSMRRALLGGNLASAAEKNGWAGVVIHGAVRDVEEMARCQIGIRALGLLPMATDKRHPGVRRGADSDRWRVGASRRMAGGRRRWHRRDGGLGR